LIKTDYIKHIYITKGIKWVSSNPDLFNSGQLECLAVNDISGLGGLGECTSTSSRASSDRERFVGLEEREAQAPANFDGP